MKTSNATGKYAIFVNDGLWDILPDKEEAKAIAAEMRCALRAGGKKDSCYVKKLTKAEEREFCGTTSSESARGRAG